MKRIKLLFAITLFYTVSISQTSYVWNGVTSTAFTTTTNWTPNGLPGPADNVTIVTGANNCIIAANTTINNLTINSGVLNIGAFTFSVNGTSSAVSGTVAATTGTLFCSGATVNFGNGIGGPTINAIVIANSPSILTQRTRYNNTVIFTKTDGSVSNPSTGGNTFNSSLTMNYISTVGNGYWSMANGISDIYNGDITLNNNSLDRIILCHTSNTNQFNGNIIINQTGSSAGTSLSWNNNTGGTLASGKTITTGTFNVGWFYLQGITQASADAINITTTGTSQVLVGRGNGNNTNVFLGPVSITAPRIWATGSTYNNSVTFNKTGAGDSHNDQRQNIFNGTVEINNTSTGYFMLGFNSNDIFNENIIVSSTNTGGINLGWTTGSTSTPSLAAGKTILIGAGGFSAGTLRLGGFTHLGGASSINLNLTGTAGLLINRGTSNSLFAGTFSVTAPDITIQGGTFNGPVVFTKTGGTSTHNNGFQNIFNSTCTINQQSNSGYFMLGYNSNCLFNDDITVTSTGSGGIYLGFSSGTGTPTLATGKTISVGGAGFSTGFLYLGAFTQLGSAPMNLNLSGTSTALTLRASTIGGDFTSTSGSLLLNGNSFNSAAHFTKIGSTSDASTGDNIFGSNSSFTSSFTHNGAGGYLMLGNGNPDVFNGDVVFTNNCVNERILPAYNSAGNLFNGNITVNSTGSSSGIHFCSLAAATATLAASKTINTGTYTSGFLRLQRFTQLGNAPININLATGSTYVEYGPNASIGGNINSISPNLQLDGCNFNGTSDFTLTGVSNYYCPGGNIFNGVSSITHNGTGFFLLGNTSPDVWNSDVTFTNNSNDRILPAWASVGNFFNGNIYVNTLGSAQGIQFCGGNATATATLAATKTIAAGALGLNAGYLQLKQFTQLGNAPIDLTLNSTATYIQYGPLSNLGGNVTSVSPRLLFNGCTFNGTTNCTKNGSVDDISSGGNIFIGVSEITNSGSGYLYLGNGTSDQFLSDAIFNNTGTANSRFYFAHSHNAQTTTFGGNLVLNSNKNTVSDGWSYLVAEGINTSFSIAGNLTINNTGALQSNMRFLQGTGTNATYNGNLTINLTNSHPSTQIQMGNNGISTYSGNIVIQNTAGGTGGGVFFNTNATASSTLSSGRTISLGAGGFVSGDLSLLRFTQLSATPQTLLQTTGNARLILGPTSMFDGDVNFDFPQVFLNGTTYNGLATIQKNGAGDNDGTGGNIFNGTTVITHSGSGRLQTGSTNRDQFNALTTFNNAGSARFHFAQSHTGQTTVFNSDLILNSNKTGGADAWSYFICEGTNTSVQYNGNVTYNVQGALQSNCRVLQGTGTTATYNGNLTINLTNSHPSTQIQMGETGVSTYSGNIVVQNTAGGTSSGVFFNNGATASSTLSSGRTISLGAGGFVSGDLSLLRFTQLSATPQNLTQTTGVARIILGPMSRFDGDVNFNFPQVLLNGTTYNGIATIQKNGATDNVGIGGNIFNNTTTINNSGSGYLLTGNGSADTFNGATTFNNTGSYRIYFAHNHPSQTTTFAQNVTINSAKTGGSDQWSYLIAESNNTSVLFNGNVTINNSGSIRSDFRILNGGTTTATYNGDLSINLTNTNASTQVQLGTLGTSLYNGNITVRNTAGGAGSGVYFNTSATASSTLAATKTISLGAGGFVNGELSLIRFSQNGATAQTLTQTTGVARIILGPTSRFDGDVNFNFPQVLLNGTTYNGIATIQKNGATDNAGTGGNIFNNTTTINNSGSGYLLTGNGTADAFNGLTTFNNTGSYRVYFAHSHPAQTTTFAQNVTINSAKTGGTDQWSYLIAEGNNTSVLFNGNVTINNSGSIRSDLRILNGGTTTATYNGDLSVNLSNTNASTQINLGTTGTSSYNGNITLVNTGAGTSSGVFFNTGATATSTLANTKTISIGGSGFNGGTLSLLRFTQLGSTAQSLTQTSGTGIIISGTGTLFNADVTINFPQVFLNGATYNGAATIQKNGVTNNDCVGGNIFNGTTSITNISANYLRLANSTTDSYNGNLTLIQNNSGVLAPNFNANCNYGGDVTISANSNYTITFGSGTGTATFNGSNPQTINKSGSAANPVFTRLTMNKTSNDVTLNTRINITTTLTLTQGLINTTSSNILNMNNAAGTTIGNSLSYINGPMNYDMALNGARTLNFPIGKTADWRPAILGARHNNVTSYTYNSEVFNADAFALGYTVPLTVDSISKKHYWDINRVLTSTGVSSPTLHVNGNQTITLYYGSNDMVTDPTYLTIVKNTNTAPTTWHDIGGTGATAWVGSVTSTSAPNAFTSYSRFTLANKIGGTNPLPIELLYFTATPDNKNVVLDWATASEINNSHFDIERSMDGVNFEFLTSVKAFGNGNSVTKQIYNAIDEKPYKGVSYYRLKQVDKNEDFKYAKIVAVEFISNSYVNVFPNPASDKLTVSASEDFTKASLKIMNSLGAIVKSNSLLSNFNGTIDISDLANGVYYIIIENGETSENIKISIQK